MAGDARTNRRFFIGASVATIASVAIWPADAKTHAKSIIKTKAKTIAHKVERRSLAFHNLHTGETLDAVYWVNGRYEGGVLHEINHVLRDHRDGTVHTIDPNLLDLLVRLRQRLGINSPFEVVCGYRSPETNAIMAAMSEGVASGSFHMYGKAIDLRVPGRNLRMVQRAALSLKGGGVGYYRR